MTCMQCESYDVILTNSVSGLPTLPIFMEASRFQSLSYNLIVQFGMEACDFPIFFIIVCRVVPGYVTLLYTYSMLAEL